jgi:phosphoribosylformylglycinamidine cyclo-ligase
MAMRYADAGVHIDRADQAKQRIRALARRTFTRGVLTDIGTFGAMFQLDRRRWREPVLVASADGVGTKLKIAFATGVHSTVGMDIVNHCVNDILAQGAEPLFFLDYLAMGRLKPRVVQQIIDGMSRACRAAGCALIGGETAEMPGFYPPGEYDLAGFIIGAVEKKRVLGPSRVRPGDVLLALESSGLHTNGYSLARKLVFEVDKRKPRDRVAEAGGKIGDVLLAPHRCYWPLLKRIVEKQWVSALAHITGGGITDNLPRVLPRGTAARIELGAWPVPRIFQYLQRVGNIPQEEMLRTFNCGAGMILIVPPKHLRHVGAELRRRREPCHLIGHVVAAKPSTAPYITFDGKLPL